MKVTELMVGDWVNSRNEGNGRVTRIDQDGVVAVTYGYLPDAVVFKSQDLQPIPLTLEIMKANGYDFMDSYINYIYDSHGNEDVYFLEMTLNDDDEFVWTINRNEYDIIQLRYVHELQHVLSLLGINKEIIL